MGRISVACLVVLLLSAGCAKQAPQDEAPQGSILQVDDDGHAVQVANGTGAIAGTVRNDIGFTVAGVHLALLDTDASATTGADGRFAFVDLGPGSYTLRADHPDYLSVQEALAVPVDKVVAVEVIMLPRSSAGPGYREHIHDLWAGQDSIVVLDATLPWAGYEAGYTGHHCLFADRSGVWEPPNLRLDFAEPHQTVFQGTDRIEVVLDWEMTDSHYESLAIAWSGANSTYHWVSDWIAKGETFTIPVHPAMWDSSHQQFTLWDLWLCRDKNTPGSSDREIPFIGDVHVTMTMFRGDGPIPPEPAHPLFWANGSEISVVAGAEKRFAFPGGVGSIPQPRYERTGTDSRFLLRPDDTVIVAPGTGRIEARLDWSYTIQGTPVPPSDQATPDWSLTYKPASQAVQDITGPGDLQVATLVEEGAGFAVYEIVAASGDTDAYYQTASNWYFYLNLAGEEADANWINPCACDVRVALSVTAYQSTEFTEG